MAKVQYKKFRVVIEYKIEVNEDYQPSLSEEKHNFKQLVAGDPEIVKPKVSIEEI